MKRASSTGLTIESNPGWLSEQTYDDLRAELGRLKLLRRQTTYYYGRKIDAISLLLSQDAAEL